MVEHFPEEEVVVSSILTRGTDCITTNNSFIRGPRSISGGSHHGAAQRSGVLTRGTHSNRFYPIRVDSYSHPPEAGKYSRLLRSI